MRNLSYALLFALAAALAASSSALADFAGQTILGPLTYGSVVNGNTIGATDDNDGIISGMHIFDVWLGPDDVWALNWTGGDIVLTMTYDNTVSDLDLFLYSPPFLDDSGNFSILNTGVENILEPAAAPGTYYVLIDSTSQADAGAYTLSVTPEPATLALVGVLALFARRAR